MKAIKIASVAVAMMGLVACGNKEQDPYYELQKAELIGLAHSYEQTIQQLNASISEKDTLLQGIQSQTEPTTAIQTIPDGTGRLTFNEFSDGTIVLPNKLEYPESEVQPTNNRVYLTDTVCLRPGESWNMVLRGNTIELENNDLGIGAQISVGYRDQDYLVVSYIQDYMTDNFFNGWPPDSITYSVLMNSETKTGMDAYTHTFIDSEDAWVRVGMLCYGNSTITYTACYKGAESQVANRAIKDLIESIEIGGTALKIEG